MRSRSDTSGCCPECLAELPDHWLSDIFRYCPHRRVVSQSRGDGTWQIDHCAFKFLARIALWRIMRRFRREARRAGLTVELLDKLMRLNRPPRKAAAPRSAPHQLP